MAVSYKGLLEVYQFNWLWTGQETLMAGSFFSFSMWVYSPFVVVVVLCCMSKGHTLMYGLSLLLQRNLGTEDVGLILTVLEWSWICCKSPLPKDGDVNIYFLRLWGSNRMKYIHLLQQLSIIIGIIGNSNKDNISGSSVHS